VVHDVSSLSTYAASIGMGQPLIDRLRSLYGFAQSLAPRPIEDVFVSEYMDPNKRQFGNVFLFYSGGFLEGENWITENMIWQFSLRPVNYLVFKTKDGNWHADDDSALTLTANWTGGFQMELRATGAHCEKLIQIHQKILIPLMEKPRTRSEKRG
jgi:hypothetical protein